jgi:hypothetical protein
MICGGLVGWCYFRRFEGKPIRDLWLFSQTATRRLRRELRVWTLRATFSRKIVNFRDPQVHTSWSPAQWAR